MAGTGRPDWIIVGVGGVVCGERVRKCVAVGFAQPEVVLPVPAVGFGGMAACLSASCCGLCGAVTMLPDLPAGIRLADAFGRLSAISCRMRACFWLVSAAGCGAEACLSGVWPGGACSAGRRSKEKTPLSGHIAERGAVVAGGSAGMSVRSEQVDTALDELGQRFALEHAGGEQGDVDQLAVARFGGSIVGKQVTLPVGQTVDLFVELLLALAVSRHTSCPCDCRAVVGVRL